MGREPARAVEARREIEIAHAVISVVGCEALVDAVDVVRRAAHRHAVAVALQQTVELCQIVDHGVERAEHMALAVDIGLFAEQGMAIAVVRDLVPLPNDALEQLGTVQRAAVGVLPEAGVVVVGRAAPRRTAERAADVGVVAGRIADDVKGALGAEFVERVEQDVRQGAAAEGIRGRRECHRAVVEGHGADALIGFHALDAAGVGDAAGRFGQEHALGKALHFFSDADEGTHVPPLRLRRAQSAA